MSAIKTVKAPVPPKKNAQRTPSKPQKTILIKNQLGQTVSVFSLNRALIGASQLPYLYFFILGSENTGYRRCRP